jgi:competence protein ComEA
MKLFASFVFACALICASFAADESNLPPGKGREIVQKTCVGCHLLKVVTSKRASREQWSTLVDQMVSRGADVPDDEMENLINYLSKNFGPADPAAANDKTVENKSVDVNAASASELSEVLGISSKDADAIVAYRVQNGAFKEWHDLMNVPRIEAKKIEDNKDRITF